MEAPESGESLLKILFSDLERSLRNPAYWWYYSINDLHKPFRGTYFGLVWLVLSPLAFIMVLGPLYSHLFDVEFKTYFVHLAIGYIYWLFLQQVVVTGPKIFKSNKAIILQGHVPLSSFAIRAVLLETFKLMFGLVIILAAFLITGTQASMTSIALALSMTIFLIFAAFWVSILLGFVTLWIPDLRQILPLTMRLAFFATPILWMERDLGNYGEFVAAINPFGHAISLVREPLMLNTFDISHLFVLVGITLVMMACVTFAMARARKSVGYLV